MQLTHLECPYCNHKDCFSHNTDTGQYYCHSCGENGREGIEENLQVNNNVVEMSPQSDPYARDYRGIYKAVIEKHGGYFTKDNEGNETAHWVYPSGTKHRQLPKTIRVSGKMDSFFGQDEYSGGRVITITEGEEDRLSVIQMMGDYPCVSVPGASPSKAFWENAKDYLRNFEKIYLSIDNDEAGNKLAETFSRIFPGKVYRVNHSKYKDANEYLENKADSDYKSAWWNAQRMKPENVLSTKEDFIRLFHETPDYEYCPTGIEELDDKILGLHKGSFTVIVAPTGIGKTEFMRYLEYQVLSQSQYSIAVCHLEETPLRSALGLVSYDLQVNLTRKDLVEQQGAEGLMEEAFERLTKDERLYQFQIRTDESYEQLVEQIRFLVHAMGIDFVFFEPIQDVVTGNVADKESKLSDLSNTLKRLAPEINVGIICIAHANEDGDTKYCKTIAQSAAFEIILDRDQDAEDEYERNKMYIRVGRKNRTGGGNGPAGALTFDRSTYMLTPEVSPVADSTDIPMEF